MMSENEREMVKVVKVFVRSSNYWPQVGLCKVQQTIWSRWRRWGWERKKENWRSSDNVWHASVICWFFSTHFGWPALSRAVRVSDLSSWNARKHREFINDFVELREDRRSRLIFNNDFAQFSNMSKCARDNKSLISLPCRNISALFAFAHLPWLIDFYSVEIALSSSLSFTDSMRSCLIDSMGDELENFTLTTSLTLSFRAKKSRMQQNSISWDHAESLGCRSESSTPWELN